jgi:hypothetical protein
MLGLLAVLPSCSAPGIEVDVGFMQTQLSGDITFDDLADTLDVGAVDVEQDLGLNDPSNSFYGRAEIDLTFPHITVSGFQYDEVGTGVLSAGFGGINANVPVRSEVEASNVKAALTFDFDIGPVRISPGAALSVLDFNLTVTDITGIGSLVGAPEQETFDEVLPIPLAFVQTEVDLGIASATVDVGAIDVEVQDVDGTFVDVEALLKIHPWDHTSFFVGYRLISADVDGSFDDERFTGDLALQGWMIGGGLKF